MTVTDWVKRIIYSPHFVVFVLVVVGCVVAVMNGAPKGIVVIPVAAYPFSLFLLNAAGRL
ncbi:hypothetical protein LCGC14_1362730 [marine sediment metagenome]|uniref:Uncharacterized protein n=1 Tax=marine sediment metagenome TaxID=412755 RepID=A0A0F9KTP3_9ZZZZ